MKPDNPPVCSVDARHLLCPLPVIRMQTAIEQVAIGQTVEIVCTDPGACHDIPAWCRVHGHALNTMREEGSEYWFVIEKH